MPPPPPYWGRGERYICSLEGSRTSANQCALRYGGGGAGQVCAAANGSSGNGRGGGNGGDNSGRRHHRAHPTAGGPWEEARERQLGATGAQ